MNSQTENKIDTSSNYARLLRLATYASVSVALILIGAKFAAWVMTDSVSLLSTLIDSLLDAAASLVTLFAVCQALQPPDAHHRFGHGKAEPLAGLGQAAFITGSAVFLLIQAIERLLHPQMVVNVDIGVFVMIFSIAITFALIIFQRVVISKTNSIAIKGDLAHYQMDVLVNVSVLAALLLSTQFNWVYADPIFAMGISIYIIWGAWRIGIKALDLLMDRELRQEDRDHIRSIVLSHPGVRSIHDMRTRSSGAQSFIQFHLEMDGNMTLFDAHTISDQVEAELMRAFPMSEIIIHEDPEGLDEQHAEMAYQQFPPNTHE
jgi:ferrous-iron efflux pump FieF